MRSAAVFAVAVFGTVARLPSLGEAVRFRGWPSGSEKSGGLSFVESSLKFGNTYEEIQLHAGPGGSFFISLNGSASSDVPEEPQQVPNTSGKVPESPHEESEQSSATKTFPPRSEESDPLYACIRRGFSSTATTAAAHDNVTLDACMKLCQTTDGCTHYTYNSVSKHCQAYSGEPTFQETVGAVTGARTCDDRCYATNIDYVGSADISEPIKTPFPVDCQAVCAANSACSAFVYNNADSTCHFKGSGYEKYLTTASGTVTGNKFCA